MSYERITSDHGWTRAIKAGPLGIALLFYRPKKRLSLSIWTGRWSTNLRIKGGAALS